MASYTYIQKTWPFQLQFEIDIFGVMILQMKQKTKFWKIGPRTFKGIIKHNIPRKQHKTLGSRLRKSALNTQELIKSHHFIMFIPIWHESSIYPIHVTHV